MHKSIRVMYKDDSADGVNPFRPLFPEMVFRPI